MSSFDVLADLIDRELLARHDPQEDVVLVIGSEERAAAEAAGRIGPNTTVIEITLVEPIRTFGEISEFTSPRKPVRNCANDWECGTGGAGADDVPAQSGRLMTAALTE